MLRSGLEPWHIIVIAIVILILFGWNKLPDMARSFGRSARILRSEVAEMKNDKKSETTTQTVPSQAHAPSNTPAPVPGEPAATAPSAPMEHDVPVKDAADSDPSGPAKRS